MGHFVDLLHRVSCLAIFRVKSLIVLTFTPIGTVRSCFKEKFGIPRQPGLVPGSRGQIAMHPPFDQEDAFDGLEHCSHIWLQFVFHQSVDHHWQPKVRPPRLGGNRSIGVFATRSPFRPNNLGLSVVRYLGWVRERGQLLVNIGGLDLLDQTPILDIKPYLPYVDHVPMARNDFAQEAPLVMPVRFSDAAERACSVLAQDGGIDWRQLIIEVLQQDPRPAYHRTDSQRVYGCRLYEHNVRWIVRHEQGVEMADVLAVDPVI